MLSVSSQAMLTGMAVRAKDCGEIKVFLIWIVTGMFDGFGGSTLACGEFPCDFLKLTLLLQYLLSLNVLMVGGECTLALSCSRARLRDAIVTV